MFIITKTLKGRPVSINLDHVVKFKPAQYVEKGKAIAFYADGSYDILQNDYSQIQEFLATTPAQTQSIS